MIVKGIMDISSNLDTRDNYSHSRVEVFVALVLIIGILAIYFQTRHHEFVVYDDRTYITENPPVLDGLTAEGFHWAFSFTEKDKTYWHPLTWLSHMLDVQLFGINAGRHLMINVLLHILNTLLLIHVFRRMTGRLWPPLIAAALFAWHPLNVESVAWVAARKNLLSTLLWLFTTLAYLRYTDKPSLRRYVLILAIFSLGLLSKPMLVTLPCVLLLLDFWPLQRCRLGTQTATEQPQNALGWLLVEKIPLLALSAVSVYISTFSIYNYGDLVPVESVGMKMRLANALVSYVAYLGKMAVPVNLTCYYPFPSFVPLWKAAGALFFLLASTAAAIRWFRPYPFVLVGWLWYLGTLFPVIGLMQAGLWPATADRFTYIPLVGIFIIIAWGAEVMASKGKRNTAWVTISLLVVLVVFGVLSFKQAGYWKNSITLFKHAIAVTEENYLSHYALGYTYEKKGMIDDAVIHYNAALAINPSEVDVRYNLAILLASRGDYQSAVRHYKEILRIEPSDAQAHNNLGNIFFRQEKWDIAVSHYRKAIQINPGYAKAHNNLGAVMFNQGRIPEAVHHFSETLRIDPGHQKARQHLHMAMALLDSKSEPPASADDR